MIALIFLKCFDIYTEVEASTALQLMTTLILKERDNYFTLVTAKSKEIGVYLFPNNHVGIYIRQSGGSKADLPRGKHFRSLCEAIDGYKSEVVKRALKDLAQHLGAPSYIYA